MAFAAPFSRLDAHQSKSSHPVNIIDSHRTHYYMSISSCINLAVGAQRMLKWAFALYVPSKNIIIR